MNKPEGKEEKTYDHEKDDHYDFEESIPSQRSSISTIKSETMMDSLFSSTLPPLFNMEAEAETAAFINRNNEKGNQKSMEKEENYHKRVKEDGGESNNFKQEQEFPPSPLQSPPLRHYHEEEFESIKESPFPSGTFSPRMQMQMDQNQKRNQYQEQKRNRNQIFKDNPDTMQDETMDTIQENSSASSLEEESFIAIKRIKSFQKARGRKRGKDEESSDYNEKEFSEASQYSKESSETEEEYEESGEDGDEYSSESEKYEQSEEDGDEEEWDERRKKYRNKRNSSSRFHENNNDLLPLLATTIPMFSKTSLVPLDQLPPGPPMTVSQIQQITKSTIEQLASATPSSGRKLPILLPKTPEATINIRTSLGEELKGTLAGMLQHPSWRAALLAKVQGNLAAKGMDPPPPSHSHFNHSFKNGTEGEINDRQESFASPSPILSAQQLINQKSGIGMGNSNNQFPISGITNNFPFNFNANLNSNSSLASIPLRPRESSRPSQRNRERERERNRERDGKDGRKLIFNENDNSPIATRRSRRTPAKSIDYKKFYKKDSEFDEEGVSSPSESSIDEDGNYKRGGDASEDELHSEREQGSNRLVNKRVTKSSSSSMAISTVSSEEEPGVEKILSFRKNKEEGGIEQFYVKFKGMAYIHSVWISREEMEAEPHGASRIKKFLSQPLSVYHYSRDHVFNPEFAQPERVVYGWEHDDPDNANEEDEEMNSNETGNGNQTGNQDKDETEAGNERIAKGKLSKKKTWSYLIKWGGGLPYEAATWEKRSFVESLLNGTMKIKEFERRKSLRTRLTEQTTKVGIRVPASDWEKYILKEYKSASLDRELRDYQLEGVNWLFYCWAKFQSSIIADEMGLGKTVQSVAFLKLLHDRFKIRGPFLIIAPLSTIPHWSREFAAWTDLNVLVYHGSTASRQIIHEYEFYYDLDKESDDVLRMLGINPRNRGRLGRGMGMGMEGGMEGSSGHSKQGPVKFDVLLTTYEMALAGYDQLQPITWRVAIFDEAHRLKNRASKAAEALMTFPVEHKILLTGTPLQNNLEELFALLHFLQPTRFSSEEAFLKEYGHLERSEDVSKLQELLRPLMLRRLKEDVEKTIPVKEETIIEVELTPVQKSYYRAILEKNFTFLNKGTTSQNTPHLLNVMMELRKCCIHPYLIKGAEERIHSETLDNTIDPHEIMIQASGKLVLLDKLLAKLQVGGHKVLIFSQMTKCLDLLVDYMRLRDYSFERIDGSIRGDLRQAAIDRFCDPKGNSFIFLLCTRAGGVGINLTAADTVVIFDSDWNPQNDLQAQARCHRIGQEKSVKVYRLLTRGTYEREMFDKAGMKLGLDKAVLQQMRASSSVPLKDEIDSEASASTTNTTNLPSSSQQLSKKEVETLLKRGAYGLLMNSDEAGLQFCAESIDQILERRTTVISHNQDGRGLSNGAEGSSRPQPTSIFSKASFTTTKAGGDAFDVDLDDPNFWQIWAKRMEMDPKQILGSTGMSLEEPRIKRQFKRIKANIEEIFALNDSSILNFNSTFITPTPTTPIDTSIDQQIDIVNNDNCIWPEKDLLNFIITAIHHGISNIKQFNLSRNETIARARVILKYCIERHGIREDTRFREDHEKLLLSHLDYDKDDNGTIDNSITPTLPITSTFNSNSISTTSTSNIKNATSPKEGFARENELRAYIKDATSPSLAYLQQYAAPILLRFQLFEFLRDVMEDGSGIFDSIGTSGSLELSWWNDECDRKLIEFIYNNGFYDWNIVKNQLFKDKIKEQEEKQQLNETGKDERDKESNNFHWPSDESFTERFVKIILAGIKKRLTQAKIAAHQTMATFAVTHEATNRRRGNKFGSKKDEDEYYDSNRGSERKKKSTASDSSPPPSLDADPAFMEKGKGKETKASKTPSRKRGAVKDTSNTPTSSQPLAFPKLTNLSQKDQVEFVKVIMQYGLPFLPESEGEKRDWSIFCQLGLFSESLKHSSKAFEDYLVVFLENCNKVAEERSTRKKSKTQSDDEWIEDSSFMNFMSNESESGNNNITNNSLLHPFKRGGLIRMTPERAQKALQRIKLFNSLRLLLYSIGGGVNASLEELLSRARKTTAGMPKWWQSGKHDAALLRAAGKWGIGRADVIISEEFAQTFYDQYGPLPERRLEQSSQSQSIEESMKKMDSLASKGNNDTTMPSLSSTLSTRKRRSGAASRASSSIAHSLLHSSQSQDGNGGVSGSSQGVGIGIIKDIIIADENRVPAPMEPNPTSLLTWPTEMATLKRLEYAIEAANKEAERLERSRHSTIGTSANVSISTEGGSGPGKTTSTSASRKRQGSLAIKKKSLDTNINQEEQEESKKMKMKESENENETIPLKKDENKIKKIKFTSQNIKKKNSVKNENDNDKDDENNITSIPTISTTVIKDNDNFDNIDPKDNSESNKESSKIKGKPDENSKRGKNQKTLMLSSSLSEENNKRVKTKGNKAFTKEKVDGEKIVSENDLLYSTNSNVATIAIDANDDINGKGKNEENNKN